MGAGTTFLVDTLAALPSGDVVAAGATLTANPSTNYIARWNGSAWSPMGVGMDGPVRSLAVTTSGLAVGGDFSSADGVLSPWLARFATTCPAFASAVGNGCGGRSLAATTLPWVDTTFVATGSGFAANAIVVTATSVNAFPQGVAPLAALLPGAGAGCDLLVLPDIVTIVNSFAGTARSSLFLPNVPPLVGVTFFHQMIPFETSPDIVGATNALRLTAGRF